MFIYINATDPRSPIDLRLWEDGEWKEFVLPRVSPGGPLAVLDAFLKERHKTIFNVRALFVFMGQGSFTATRSVVTIANALALSATLPIIAVKHAPTDNPEILIATTPSHRYITPEYSAPARIGPPAAA